MGVAKKSLSSLRLIKMNKITAIILTYNEVETIEGAIGSIIDCCNEILIIDSGSDDGTLDIVKKYSSVKVINNKFKNFSEQRNFGIQHADSPWILFIDADEEIDNNLKNILKNSNLEAGYAYKFKRKNKIWGDWLVDGIGKDFQIRLFENNNKIRYIREVHEVLVGYENCLLLNGEILHYQKSDIETLIKKQNKYTNHEIETGDFDNDSNIILLLRPWYVLIKHVVIYKAWKSGLRGICWAIIVFNYELMKTLKIFEKKHKWSEK